MRASPRPSRGRGSDGSSSIALAKAAFASPVRTRVRCANPRTDCVRARFGASSVALRAASRAPSRFPSDERISASRAQARASLGSSCDGLLQARAGALQVERGLLRVGEGDLRGRRLRVGRDRPAGQREGLVVLVPRHGHDRLQREGVAVVLGQLQGLVEVLAGLLDAARGQEERGPVGEEPRVADLGGRDALEAGEGPVEVALAPGVGGLVDLGLPGGALPQLAGLHGEDREVVERPLHGVLGAHRDRRARVRRPCGAVADWPPVSSRLPASFWASTLPSRTASCGALAVGLDGQAQLGAAHGGDGAAGGEPRRPFLPAHHVGPQPAEEDGDVPLRRGLVDLDARVGADAEHRPVGAGSAPWRGRAS